MLSDESGSVVVKPCTAREVAFYEATQAHPEFARWVPTFLGTLTPDDSAVAAIGAAVETAPVNPHNRHSSLVLENVACGFSKPCVLDAKLGAQLWDEFAPQEKRDRLDAVSDATTSGSLGFRVAGMKVWKGDKDGYKVYDKLYGRVFTADNVIDAFKEYFASGLEPEQVRIVVGRLLAKVGEIREMLEGQESRMYSASLLFVFEGDGKAFQQALEDEKNRKPEPDDDDDEDEDGEDDEDEEVKKVEALKLIDFAHADWTPGQGPDENALQGVRSVEKLLAQLA